MKTTINVNCVGYWLIMFAFLIENVPHPSCRINGRKWENRRKFPAEHVVSVFRKSFVPLCHGFDCAFALLRIITWMRLWQTIRGRKSTDSYRIVFVWRIGIENIHNWYTQASAIPNISVRYNSNENCSPGIQRNDDDSDDDKDHHDDDEMMMMTVGVVPIKYFFGGFLYWMQSQTAQRSRLTKNRQRKQTIPKLMRARFCLTFAFVVFHLSSFFVFSVCRCAVASRACVDNFDFMSKAFVSAVVHMKPNVQSDQIEITCKQNDGRNRRTGPVDAWEQHRFIRVNSPYSLHHFIRFAANHVKCWSSLHKSTVVIILSCVFFFCLANVRNSGRLAFHLEMMWRFWAVVTNITTQNKPWPCVCSSSVK